MRSGQTGPDQRLPGLRAEEAEASPPVSYWAPPVAFCRDVGRRRPHSLRSLLFINNNWGSGRLRALALSGKTALGCTPQ